MAAANTIDEIILLASAMFQEDIVESIKNAKFTMEDVEHLTRNDVDQEFKQHRFGIRKSLWLFFCAFKTKGNKEIESSLMKETDFEGTSCIQLTNIQSPQERSLIPIDGPEEVVVTAILESDEEQLNMDESDSDHDEMFVPSHANGLPTTVPSPKSALAKLNTNKDQQLLQSQAGGFLSKSICIATVAVPQAKLNTKNDVHQSSGTGRKLDPRWAKIKLSTEKEQHSSQKADKRDASHPDDDDSYPGEIPTPFPLSKSSRRYLAKGRKFIMENEGIFHTLVREVCDVLWHSLGRRPTLMELRNFDEKFCREHPALRSSGRFTDPTFYRRVRKRINGMTRRAPSQRYKSKVVSPRRTKEELWVNSPSLSAEKSSPLMAAYPGDIPTPFPLGDCSKKILEKGKQFLAERNMYGYHFVVKEISDILWSHLKRKPTIEEMRVVKTNLCLEYPVLHSDCKFTDSLFYQRLRKRINGVERAMAKRSNLHARSKRGRAGKIAANARGTSYRNSSRAVESGNMRENGRIAAYLIRYLQPPALPLSDSEREPYPGKIPSPFPLSDACKEFLTLSRRETFVKNRILYLAMSREVTNILYRNLSRKATASEMKTVAKNLSLEYPILQCDGKTNYNALYVYLHQKMKRLPALEFFEGGGDGPTASGAAECEEGWEDQMRKSERRRRKQSRPDELEY